MVLITLTISPDFAKSSAALKRTSGRRSTNTTVFRRLPCMVPVVKPMTIFSPSRAWQARPLLPARAWRHPRFPHPASAYAGGKTRPRPSGRGAIALRIVRPILPAAAVWRRTDHERQLRRYQPHALHYPRQKKLRAVGDLPPSLHGQGRARRSRRKTVYVLPGETTARE